jgi:hypothetical protein
VRRHSRFPVPGLLPGLVLALTTACTASWAGGGSRSSAGGSSASARSSSPSGARTVSLVSCTGSSCSVTLGGRGSSVEVFGVPLVFDSIAGGRASVRVGGTPVTCTEGERVTAGRLQLSCTRVTGDTVSFAGTMH